MRRRFDPTQPDILFHDKPEEARYLAECRGLVRFFSQQIAHELNPKLLRGPSRRDIAHYQQRRRWYFLTAKRLERELA